MNKHLLITTCTNRKRLPVPERLKARNLDVGPQKQVAVDWLDRLAQRRADGSIAQAYELYCGRGFREARLASFGVDRLWIVSAGLGLVAATDPVPAYGLTVATGASDSVADKIVGKFDLPSWWDALQSARTSSGSISSLMVQTKSSLAVLALSSTYYRLIEKDLLALPKKHVNRLRIVGIKPSNADQQLRHVVMPYDDRFDGPDSVNVGTRADFPQRATRHFVERVLNAGIAGNAECHAKEVSRQLAFLRAPMRVARRRTSDHAIGNAIRKNWNRLHGRSGQMLRFLRDELGIACEQTRFKNLFHSVSNEIEARAR